MISTTFDDFYWHNTCAQPSLLCQHAQQDRRRYVNSVESIIDSHASSMRHLESKIDLLSTVAAADRSNFEKHGSFAEVVCNRGKPVKQLSAAVLTPRHKEQQPLAPTYVTDKKKREAHKAKVIRERQLAAQEQRAKVQQKLSSASKLRGEVLTLRQEEAATIKKGIEEHAAERRQRIATSSPSRRKRSAHTTSKKLKEAAPSGVVAVHGKPSITEPGKATCNSSESGQVETATDKQDNSVTVDKENVTEAPKTVPKQVSHRRHKTLRQVISEKWEDNRPPPNPLDLFGEPQPLPTEAACLSKFNHLRQMATKRPSTAAGQRIESHRRLTKDTDVAKKRREVTVEEQRRLSEASTLRGANYQTPLFRGQIITGPGKQEASRPQTAGRGASGQLFATDAKKPMPPTEVLAPTSSETLSHKSVDHSAIPTQQVELPDPSTVSIITPLQADSRNRPSEDGSKDDATKAEGVRQEEEDRAAPAVPDPDLPDMTSVSVSVKTTPAPSSGGSSTASSPTSPTRSCSYLSSDEDQGDNSLRRGSSEQDSTPRSDRNSSTSDTRRRSLSSTSISRSSSRSSSSSSSSSCISEQQHSRYSTRSSAEINFIQQEPQLCKADTRQNARGGIEMKTSSEVMVFQKEKLRQRVRAAMKMVAATTGQTQRKRK